jgi:hypothetical protein
MGRVTVPSTVFGKKDRVYVVLWQLKGWSMETFSARAASVVSSTGRTGMEATVRPWQMRGYSAGCAFHCNQDPCRRPCATSSWQSRCRAYYSSLLTFYASPPPLKHLRLPRPPPNPPVAFASGGYQSISELITLRRPQDPTKFCFAAQLTIGFAYWLVGLVSLLTYWW